MPGKNPPRASALHPSTLRKTGRPVRNMVHDADIAFPTGALMIRSQADIVAMNAIASNGNSGCAEAADDLLRRSSLYREFLAEREEILRHKWLESEKAGRDIGFENALVSWVVHHRFHWRRARSNN